MKVKLDVNIDSIDNLVSQQLEETFEFIKDCYTGAFSTPYDAPKETWKMLQSLKLILDYYGVNVALPEKIHGKKKETNLFAEDAFK